MNSDEYRMLIDRDAIVVNALASALGAMSAVNGSRIAGAGIAGVLTFEAEMLKVHEALLLMGVDSNDLGHVPD